MKLLVYGGVRGQNSEYVFDYTYDYPEDILDLVPLKLYKVDNTKYVYWFGYKFKKGVSSRIRSDFIKYLKGLKDPAIHDSELRQFIDRPLGELDKEISTYNIDCIVYPKSNRSTLVNKILSEVGRFVSRDSSKCSFELVKSAPTDIEFDWDLFDLENSDNVNY